jgi:protein gp37
VGGWWDAMREPRKCPNCKPIIERGVKMGTKIEYVDESINPIRTKDGGWHCVKSSTGCLNCYAEGINKRFGDKRNYGIVGAGQKPVELVLSQKALEKPLKWKKSKIIFIQDMSDLFLPGIDYVQDERLKRSYFEAVRQTWLTMRHCEWHTFIVLTKHPQRMYDFYKWTIDKYPSYGFSYPNIWLGVTAENQEQADKRIPILLQIPSAIKFVSIEPMLGAVDLSYYANHCGRCHYQRNICNCGFSAMPQKFKPSLNWVICGTESISNRPGRSFPRHIAAITALKNQCVEADVPFFLKQMQSEFDGYEPRLIKMPELDGRVWNQFPGGR